MNFLRRFRSGWNQFWFEQIPAEPLRIFRIVHGATLLLFLAAWWPHASEWLTSSSFHFSNELLPPLPRALLPYFCALQFASGLCLILGWKPKWGAIISLILLAYVTLIDRVASFSINSIYLFTLAVLSVYLKNKPTGEPISAAPIRLLQVALVAIYFSSGWNKAVYGDWLDSPTTLWTTTQGIYMTDAAAWALRTFPIPFWSVAQYSILAFELFSPVLFFTKRTTLFAIAAGVIFHLGIALFMDKLIFFSLQMMSFYVLFLPFGRNHGRRSLRFFRARF